MTHGTDEIESAPTAFCIICRSQEPLTADNCGKVQGNTLRFRNMDFSLWKCSRCLSIHSLKPVDFKAIYEEYALNRRRLDVFARGTFRNLLKRLKRAGLERDHSILDYGCGNGLFVGYLRERGYGHVQGYDPYFAEFSKAPEPRSQFDCLILNDVIEHCEDLRGIIADCIGLLKPGGLLYIGTADSQPVDPKDLKRHVMRLHQPFHRTIVTAETLRGLVSLPGIQLIGSYRRSYMDTVLPFSNYRFLDELHTAVGHNLDAALSPKTASSAVLRSPRLWLFGLFGYFFPSAYEPAVIVRRLKE